ncbi:hypothetical protein TorRG33x02_232130 [Trema orientale]|uniref:Uncharacterized protein n=1 Tax=Trema orientale TaxID=63057 RepID=A0A2P5E630_TREOI|nr:hypothetical protein TorRG33x02_232130 [Trema orientale]
MLVFKEADGGCKIAHTPERHEDENNDWGGELATKRSTSSRDITISDDRHRPMDGRLLWWWNG